MNTPVSFEIAKLLLEKKFSWETGDEDDYEKGRHGYFRRHKSGNIAAISYYHFDTNHNAVQWINLNIPAPTIAEVVMWLYEKHGIWIYTQQEGKNQWIYFYDSGVAYIAGREFYSSPTEAYKAAIEYLLTKLI